MYVVQPINALWFGRAWEEKGKKLPDGFTYTSENNTDWLDVKGILKFITPIEAELEQEKAL